MLGKPYNTVGVFAKLLKNRVSFNYITASFLRSLSEKQVQYSAQKYIFLLTFLPNCKFSNISQKNSRYNSIKSVDYIPQNGYTCRYTPSEYRLYRSFPIKGYYSGMKGGFAMKIERLNDNQIRCTLDKKDLLERQLKISELAYGSDKANALFRDMIQQASNECDFEADDIPLMIEAIPVSPDCLVLLITKVNDPEELDTRFSSFTAAPDEDREGAPVPEEKTYADEILNCFEHLSDILGEQLSEKLLGKDLKNIKGGETSLGGDSDNSKLLIKNLCKVYSFATLDEVVRTAKVIHKIYHGENTLYKNPVNSRYYLVTYLSEHTAFEFNKVCNIISEYGRTEKLYTANIAHFDEHFEVIVRNKAVQVLYKM